MSKKTRSDTPASTRRYVGRRGSSSTAGGIILPREQIDDVVDELVSEFGEERAETILCAAEEAEVSFVEWLWRERLVPEERIQAMCTAAKLSPGKPRRRGDRFDPCFQPEAWPWEAPEEPSGGKVLSGASARQFVIDRALQSGTWELLINRIEGFRVSGDGGSEPAQLGIVFEQRCSALASLLSAFGWPAVTGSDNVLREASSLTDASDARAWLRTGNEFLKAVEYRIEWLTEEVPILEALHAAIEETQLLWLDGVQTQSDGNYRVHWVATEARKIHAIQGLRRMGVATANGASLREKLQAQGQDLPQGLGSELDDWVTLRDLREAEGMRLLHIATVFGYWLAEHQERLREEWGATLEACLSVLQSLIDDSQAAEGDEAPELIEEGLGDLQGMLAALGLEEARDDEGRVFPLTALRSDAPDLIDAVVAWRSTVAGADPRESQERYQCWGMLGFIERTLTEEHFGQVVANLTSATETWHQEGSATGRRTEQIGQGAEAGAAPPVLREFAEASKLDLLRSVLAPAATVDQLEDLEAVIRDAQEVRPEDPEAFVRDVNRILDAQNLRLSVEGEEHLARLSIKKGSISLAVAGGRGNQGFRGKTLRVVPVDESYALRGARPRVKPTEHTP